MEGDYIMADTLTYEEFKSSGITDKTPKNIVFGAGTIHKGLRYDASKKTWNFAESLIGATSGGTKLSIKPELKDIEVDGASVKVKELAVKIGETAQMDTNMVELSPETIKMAIIGQNGTSTAEGYDKDCMRSDINYNITQIKNRYNHLICLGQGELKDRQVLHLYIDKRGNITDTQAFKGFEERTAVYDYSSATDMDELKSGGIARLQELNADRLDMTLPDMAMQIGDITGGTEKFTGATVKKQITNIIAKIDDNSIDIEYSVS